MTEELQTFFDAVVAEEHRIEKDLQMHTWAGMVTARNIFSAHFNRPVMHGDNVKYDLARVNVIRRNKGQEGLC